MLSMIHQRFPPFPLHTLSLLFQSLDLDLDGNFQQESKVQFVYDAVYALVYALAAMRHKYCAPSGSGSGSGSGGGGGGEYPGLCEEMLTRLASDDLYQHILNVSFIGMLKIV